MSIETVAQEVLHAQQDMEATIRRYASQMPQEAVKALITSVNNERAAIQELVHSLHEQGNPSASFRARGSRGILDTLGHAIEYGAGFGIGEDIVRKIL